MKQAEAAQARHYDDVPTRLEHDPVPRIDSEAILDGRRYVILVHAGMEYQLRVTRNNKLILNR